MKFIQNLINYKTEHKLGACPFCGQEQLQQSYKKLSENKGFGVIWCNRCKHAEWISRMIVTDDLPQNIPVPLGLIYK